MLCSCAAIIIVPDEEGDRDERRGTDNRSKKPNDRGTTAQGEQ